MSLTDRSFPFRAGPWSQRCARFTVALLAGFTAGVGHSGPAAVSGTTAQVVFVADRASEGVPLDASAGCGLAGFQSALEHRLNGENLAAGQSTVDGVIAGWLASPGHCSNLMSRQFEAVGVSCARQAGSRFGHYWVMVLARP